LWPFAKRAAAKKTAHRPREAASAPLSLVHLSNPKGIPMKFRTATAIALCLAFTQMAVPSALARDTAQQFRTVEARSFSQDELQRYGLSAQDAAQVGAYQDAGYQVQVMTPEEASQVTGGQFSNSQWLVIGLIVIVIVVAVAAD